jgi:hypothetical protein
LTAGAHAAEVSQNRAADVTDRVTWKRAAIRAAPETAHRTCTDERRWTRQNGSDDPRGVFLALVGNVQGLAHSV